MNLMTLLYINQTTDVKEQFDFAQGYIEAKKRKLLNNRFLDNARPEIIKKEEKELEDAERILKELTIYISQRENNEVI